MSYCASYVSLSPFHLDHFRCTKDFQALDDSIDKISYLLVDSYAQNRFADVFPTSSNATVPEDHIQDK